ncbi:MAG: hypothetical protein LBJ31_03010 [Treponema sp.]|nr:hypothetical protein [Treponema sp.]
MYSYGVNCQRVSLPDITVIVPLTKAPVGLMLEEDEYIQRNNHPDQWT